MNLGEFETNVTCLQDFVDIFFEQLVFGFHANFLAVNFWKKVVTTTVVQ